MSASRPTLTSGVQQVLLPVDAAAPVPAARTEEAVPVGREATHR